MVALIFAFGISLMLSLLLTNWVRRWGLKLRILDYPDGDRKTHHAPVPRIGGVGIFLAASITVLMGSLIGVEGFRPDMDTLRGMLALGAGGTAIFLLGLWDDVKRLSARAKFTVEVAIALGVFLAGVRIDLLSFGPDATLVIPFWASLLITVLWLVGIANALNLLDGSDGVAGGAALFALSTMAVVSLLTGNDLSAAMCFILVGATLGFLFFNFPPASIFLGDSGSLFLGFMLAGMGVIATQKAPTLVAVAVPLVAFGVPILDTSLAVLRRVIRGQNPFHPDHGHIHHRLKDLGHSPKDIALLLYLVCALFSFLSLVLVGGSARSVGIVLLLAGSIAILTIQRLRVPELLELAKIVHWGLLRSLVVERNLKVREAAGRLETARSGEDILAALDYAFSDGEFSRIELWVPSPLGDCLVGLPGVKENGRGVVCRRDFLECPSVEMAFWEVRLPIQELGDSSVGRLSLFRLLDGKRLLTDISLLGGVFQPCLLEALKNCRKRNLELPLNVASEDPQ